MALQHSQNRDRRNDNRPPQERRQNKTFDELAAEVEKNVFNGNIKEILQMSKSTQLDGLLNSIEQFAGRSNSLGACVTTSQLRNVYDKAKNAKDVNALKLMRPNLAYIAGRGKKDPEVQKFLAFLDFLIKSVQTDEQVKEFQTFFEAVVAYHRFYGKND